MTTRSSSAQRRRSQGVPSQNHVPTQPTFFTIGHSTHPIEAFASLLVPIGVASLADVRTVPRSRTNPQFNRDTIAGALERHGIAYRHIPELGGLRGKQRDIPPETNAFWQNTSFHNYADYAMSPAFQDGLATLRALAGGRSCAIMCAEAVWWRCHRRIIADYLLHEGAAVFHVVTGDRVEPARITEAARPGPRATLVYPAGESTRSGELDLTGPDG
jgi:uncharacterized protein (DUF488 family)